MEVLYNFDWCNLENNLFKYLRKIENIFEKDVL